MRKRKPTDPRSKFIAAVVAAGNCTHPTLPIDPAILAHKEGK